MGFNSHVHVGGKPTENAWKGKCLAPPLSY